MKAPVTYADWCNLFDRFTSGDDTVFDEMNSGSFDLDAGTAQRFYFQAEKAYKARKEMWLEKFQRSFEIQDIKSIDDFEIIILTGRKNLIPLSKFSELKGLPENLKTVFKQDLEEFVVEIKKSLKDNLPNIGNEKEKMTLIINSFTLPENIEKNILQSSPICNEINPLIKRKIIF
ncbi:hypothetical protein AAEU33_05470 [Chryseobacterium sp. Chry.R1]|uniref:hypothetical protein n=1 Tax=Chryseobacterium sp. Chry.R1 TaxID=3139392 RepID=UPI0031F85DF9